MTLLAPEMVEAIVDGRQAERITLLGLMKGFPRNGRGSGPGAPVDTRRPSVGFTPTSFQGRTDRDEP